MKKIIIVLAVAAFSSCYTPKPTMVEWKVTSYYPDTKNEGWWILHATSKYGSDTFHVQCPPDSIGARFQATYKRILNK